MMQIVPVVQITFVLVHVGVNIASMLAARRNTHLNKNDQNKFDAELSKHMGLEIKGYLKWHATAPTLN